MSSLHTTRSETLGYVSLYCRSGRPIKSINSYYSTDSNGTTEREDEDTKKPLEDTRDSVSVDENRVEGSTPYEGRHFTREDVRKIMGLFMQRESVIEGVAAEYSLEGDVMHHTILYLISIMQSQSEEVRHACINHYTFSALMSLRSRDNVQAK